MKRILSYAFLILSHLIAHGQADRMLNIPENALSWYDPAVNIDSLKKLLPLANGVARVDVLCEISYALQRFQPQNTNYWKYIDEALELSEKLDYNNGRVKANFLLANYYSITKQDPATALGFSQKAEAFFDHETHWSMKFRVWMNIWVIYGRLNHRDSAAYYYQKPLEHLNEPEAWPARFIAYIWMMRHASITADYTNQRNYLEKAIELFRQHNQNAIFNVLRLLSEVEELSINLANYGEYRYAVELMNEVLDSFTFHETEDLYNAFYKAKIHGRIARIYRYWGKYDTALVHFDRSFDLFTQLYNDHHTALEDPGVYPSMRIWAINFANQLEERAIVLINKGELKQAESDLQQSISIRAEHNDLLGVGMCYDRMGEIYSIRWNFPEALKWFDSALIIKEDYLSGVLKSILGASALKLLFSRESIAATYLKTGQLYKTWNSPDLAREYFNRSYAMSVEAGSHKAEAEALVALGNLYLSLDNADSSFACFLQAKNIYQKMENMPGLAVVHESLGDLYRILFRYDDAIEKYKFSRQIYAGLDMPAHLAPLLIKQGDILIVLFGPGEALDSYETGLDIASRFDLRKTKMNAHKKLSEVYTITGEIEKAFAHFRDFVELRDGLFNLETKLHIAEIEARFESEQNRNTIRLLHAEKELIESKEARNRLVITLLAGFTVLLLLWVLLYMRHTRLKSNNKLMLIQQRLFRSQMNPHFIFNSLGSIQHSILSNEPDKAVRYLARFSKLMRSILDSSTKELVSVAEDISTIENYLTLQIVRFPNKFEYSINVDKKIDIASTFIPPMLVQPFIENAIEHGIMHKKSKGNLQIRYQRRNGMLHIEVEDDGVGRKKAMEIHAQRDKTHNGMATNITRERIDLLNRSGRKKMTFEIVDLSGENDEALGTRVEFEVPL